MRLYEFTLDDFVEFGGKKFPTKNSLGKLIYPTEEGILNFWKWFDNSKVVDNQGRPLVVYHGTGADISAFDKKDLSGVNSRHFLDFGIHFSVDSETASQYALAAGDTNSVRMHGDTNVGRTGLSSGMKIGNPSVYLAYLKAQSILNLSSDAIPTDLVDKLLQLSPNNKFAKFVNKSSTINMNFLSSIQVAVGRSTLKNVFTTRYDCIRYPFSLNGGESFVVFDPIQIKSAIGNDGRFSSTDLSITKE